MEAELLARLGASSDRPGEGAQGPVPGECDSYALWAAMTTLIQEVKLQGRAFQRLVEGVAPLADIEGRLDASLGVHATRLQGVLDRARQEASTSALDDARSGGRREARQEVVGLLLDLRDRLVRGLDSASACRQRARSVSRPGWLRRLLVGGDDLGPLYEAVEALERGHRLALDRLQEHLDQLGVQQIRCQGSPFDPHRMTAVDIEETADAPEGTVLEVYRAGYEQEGQVIRTAEVKVARTGPAAGGGASTEAEPPTRT